MKKGLTLVELLISVFFLALIGAVVLFVYTAGLRSWTSAENYAEVTNAGGLAMERMVRELSLASEITSAESDEVEFEADVDGDGSVETIKYDVDKDGRLIRAEGTVQPLTHILANAVQDLTLGYYLDQDDTRYDSVKTGGSGVTEADTIRVVDIFLEISAGDETTTLGGSAYTRNQELDDE